LVLRVQIMLCWRVVSTRGHDAATHKNAHDHEISIPDDPHL